MTDMINQPRASAGLWETCEIITKDRDDALEKIARLEKQGSKMSASQCVEPKNLCIEEGRAEVFCSAVEKIPWLEAIIADLKEMGNNKFDAIQRLTQERDALKEENRMYRKEMDKMQNGIPSEWAYAILQKERDKLKAENDFFRNWCSKQVPSSEDEIMKILEEK